MSNIFILNGHQPYPFSEGRLTEALVDRATSFFAEQGHSVRISRVLDAYDPEEEVVNHQWADLVVMQFPVNWMSVPWSLKKYMDDVYTAGMDGRLCAGDGRVPEQPKANYGGGGALKGKKYMLSATLNAPSEAFNDKSEKFFEGASLDDLLYPVHLNAKFFDMEQLPTFGAFDVMKNPEIENDFVRFDAHLTEVAARLR